MSRWFNYFLIYIFCTVTMNNQELTSYTYEYNNVRESRIFNLINCNIFKDGFNILSIYYIVYRKIKNIIIFCASDYKLNFIFCFEIEKILKFLLHLKLFEGIICTHSGFTKFTTTKMTSPHWTLLTLHIRFKDAEDVVLCNIELQAAWEEPW